MYGYSAEFYQPGKSIERDLGPFNSLKLKKVLTKIVSRLNVLLK
jgi:hypothetical protein